MIVFGTRGKVVPGARKQGVVCANCGKDEHASAGVLRYFHVFWIPVFPTMKQPLLECLHCKKVLTGKEIPERARKDVAEQVFTRGRVLPLFTGLALAAVFAVFVGVAGAQQEKAEAAWLAAPAVGDVYVVKLARFAQVGDPKYPYAVVRVSDVAGDSVALQLGTYGYERATGADRAISGGQLASADYFAPEPLTVPVQQLQPLKAEGAIHSVKRR
jgi:hypothetical protein